MGPDPGSAKRNEPAWPGKYDALQQHEDAMLLSKDGVFSNVVLRGLDEAGSPTRVSAEEEQQQQQGGTADCASHGLYSANGAFSEQLDTVAGALLRPMKKLLSVVWQNGYVCMLLAAFTFSLSVLCVKLTGSRVPVLQITLARSTISFIISAVLIKARGIKPMFGQRKHAVWLLGRGMSGAFAMMTFYVAILKLPLADANTLFFLNPCMTAVAAWAFLGEPLGLLGGCGCLISLLGLVVLTHPPMLFGGHTDWGPQRIWGTAFGVISAVGATGAFICIRFVGKAEPAIVVALSFHTSTLVMSVLPLAVGFPQPAVWLGSWDCLLLMGVAATSFFGQLSLTRGFQLLDAGKAAGLNFSQVLWGYMFGMLLFGEKLTLFGVLGTCLIALGMGCVTARTKPQTQTEKAVTVRDLAGAGVGSVLLPVRQPPPTGLGPDEARSAGLVAKQLSFQRMLRNYREPDNSTATDDLSQPQNSTDSDSLLLNVQQHVPEDGPSKVHQNAHDEVLPLQDGRTYMQESNSSDPYAGSSADFARLLQQQSHPAAAAGDSELVPLGNVQHRHHSHELQQKQQFCLRDSAAATRDSEQHAGHSGDAAPSN